MKLIFNKPLGCGDAFAPTCKLVSSDALANLAGSMATAVAGAAASGSASKKQMRLQSQLNRQEMYYSMRLQDDYTRRMLYQVPTLSVSGTKMAGLNPAMSDGGSGVAGASGGSAHPTSGAAGPAAVNSNLASQVAESAAAMNNMENQNKLTQSQVDLNKSVEDLNRKKAGLAQKDLDSYGDRLSAELANKGAITAWYNQDTQNKQEELNNLKLKGNEIQATIDEIRQNIAESMERERFTAVQRHEYKHLIDAQINNMFHQNHWYDTQAARMMQDALFDWTTKTSEADLADAQRRYTEALKRLSERYGDIDHIVDEAQKVGKTIGGFVVDVCVGIALGGKTRLLKYGGKAVKWLKKAKNFF